MDIGTEKPAIVIEPLESPNPFEDSPAAPDPTPIETPAEEPIPA